MPSNVLIPDLFAIVEAGDLPVFALVRDLRYVSPWGGVPVLVEGDVLGVDAWPGDLEDLVPAGHDLAVLDAEGHGGVLAVDTRTGGLETYAQQWWEKGVSYSRVLLALPDARRIADFIWAQVHEDERLVRDLLEYGVRRDRVLGLERPYLNELVLVLQEGAPVLDVYQRIWDEVHEHLQRRARALRDTGDPGVIVVWEPPSRRWEPRPVPAVAPEPPPLAGCATWENGRWRCHGGAPEPRSRWETAGEPSYPNIAVPELRGAALPRCFLVRDLAILRREWDGDLEAMFHEDIVGVVGGEVIDEDDAPARLLAEAYRRIVAFTHAGPVVGVDATGSTWAVVTVVPPDAVAIARWVVGGIDARPEGFHGAFRLREHPEDGTVEVGWVEASRELWAERLILSANAPLPRLLESEDGVLSERIVQRARRLVLETARARLLSG